MMDVSGRKAPIRLGMTMQCGEVPTAFVTSKGAGDTRPDAEVHAYVSETRVKWIGVLYRRSEHDAHRQPPSTPHDHQAAMAYQIPVHMWVRA